MNIVKRSLQELITPDYNPRTISKEEFGGLLASLEAFGYVDLLVVNKRNNHIVGGNQRAQALKQLGFTDIDVIEVDLDDHDERKLNVILNSQAISGVYDDLKLSELLEGFKADSDYQTLRLNELEPLDLSEQEIEEDLVKEQVFVITVRFKKQDELETALDESAPIFAKYDCNVSVNSDDSSE